MTDVPSYIAAFGDDYWEEGSLWFDTNDGFQEYIVVGICKNRTAPILVG